MEEEKIDQEIKDTAIIDTLKQQADDYLKGWQTERANFLNYQRDENERISKMITLNERNILLEIISIVDNFDLLIKNLDQNKGDEYINGINLIYNKLGEFLNHHQCFAYNSLNQIFDPNLHEAIESISDETKENNIIVEEIQKGYKLNDIILRPAKVKVIINKN